MMNIITVSLVASDAPGYYWQQSNSDVPYGPFGTVLAAFKDAEIRLLRVEKEPVAMQSIFAIAVNPRG